MKKMEIYDQDGKLNTGKYLGLIMYTAFSIKKFNQIDNCIKLYFKGVNEYFKCKL